MTEHLMHDALVTVAPRKPYEVRKFPTVAPRDDEITVSVKWTSSTPLDLHQADGGLLVEHPMRTGSTSASVVVAVGPNVKKLRVGDKVFGFAYQKPEWKAHQEFVTAPEWVFGKVPNGFKLEDVITLPETVVTAFNTLWADLNLPTPWPKPSDYIPPRAEDRILIWGAASSVGQLTIQVLKFYRYRNIVATASPNHHAYLRELGATECFDYRRSSVVDELLNVHYDRQTPTYPMIVDCIGSQRGSLTPISKIAQGGTTVAVMLPVILKHSSSEEAPEYSMDASTSASWADGVNVSGVRTHFYWKNEMFREKLQLEIMPTLLAEGIVKPIRHRIVDGKTLLERATNALDIMRTGVSGEKLIWRVSDN